MQRRHAVSPLMSRVALYSMVATMVCSLAVSAMAGGLVRTAAVGGVYIDAEGVVATPEINDHEQLFAAWQSGLEPIPADYQDYTDLRFVSLRGLEAEIKKHRTAQEPLPDAVRYLAGLLRVQYVLVYPKTESTPGDIVLAGPAEGWKVDALGNTVGATSQRPVLMLEDLIVALRSSEASNGPGISCSIDPTPEGLARVQRVARKLNADAGPQLAGRKIEQALGQQDVTITGIPETSHFARVIVAADFRMKRLAMNFDRAPVSNLPSYLDMLSNRSGASKSMLPRWWMATNYEPVLRNTEGTAWEIRGQGVKCMTEEDFVNADGERVRTAKGASTAQDWADRFTEQFTELANHDSAFGHLRNVMDQTVAAAIIVRERLPEQVGLELPWIMENEQIEAYNAPRKVASQASFVRKGRQWIISASGGVQMYPWQVADKTETTPEGSTDLAVRDQAATGLNTNWWWQ